MKSQGRVELNINNRKHKNIFKNKTKAKDNGIVSMKFDLKSKSIVDVLDEVWFSFIFMFSLMNDFID